MSTTQEKTTSTSRKAGTKKKNPLLGKKANGKSKKLSTISFGSETTHRTKFLKKEKVQDLSTLSPDEVATYVKKLNAPVKRSKLPKPSFSVNVLQAHRPSSTQKPSEKKFPQIKRIEETAKQKPDLQQIAGADEWPEEEKIVETKKNKGKKHRTRESRPGNPRF